MLCDALAEAKVRFAPMSTKLNYDARLNGSDKVISKGEVARPTPPVGRPVTAWNESRERQVENADVIFYTG
jgi:hypothetical protein